MVPAVSFGANDSLQLASEVSADGTGTAECEVWGDGATSVADFARTTQRFHATFNAALSNLDKAVSMPNSARIDTSSRSLAEVIEGSLEV